MSSLIQPGGGSDGAYTLDTDSIFVIVTLGQLELEMDGETMLLDAGDATTFSARKQHNWRNPLRTDSEVLWVISPPIPHEDLERS